MVRKLLSRESPTELAKRLVAGTKLGDPAARMALWKGGAAAIAASDDPMIQLAREMEPEARKIRKEFEDKVEAPIELASEKIAKARFAVLGTSVYPDATFTLRLNWGTVGAWVENGQQVAYRQRRQHAVASNDVAALAHRTDDFVLPRRL